MKAHKNTLIAWGSVAFAIIAWWAVVVFLMGIWAQKDARSFQIIAAEEASARESTSIRLHATARDTKILREQLDGLVQIDVIKVASMIEEAGTLAGVKIKIGNVLPGSAAKKSTQNSLVLREVDFLVEADGSFSGVMHATALFEKLPAPSFIRSIEFERASSVTVSQRQSGEWHVKAHIIVLSASNTSP